MTESSERFDGLRALVTGASSGVGRATARRLLAGGAHVALVARRRDALEETALGNPAALVAPADVGDPAAASEAVAAAYADFGGLDLVVNCAAILGLAPLETLDAELWARTLATNVTGTFSIGRAAGLRMAADGGGSIVNLASDQAFVSVPGFAAYGTSKAAILGLTRSLAVELAPHVRVNVICPGPIETPMLQGGFASAPDPERTRRQTVDKTLLQRCSSAEEVADCILFLGLRATYATGSAWLLDGGITAR